MKNVVPNQEVQIWSTRRERDIRVLLKSRPLLTGSVKTERLEVQIASVCCDVEYTKREFRCATWYAKRNVSMFGMPIFGSYVRVEICLDSTKNELVYDELVVRTTPVRECLRGSAIKALGAPLAKSDLRRAVRPSRIGTTQGL